MEGLWTHNRHPIAHLHGWAMGCLLWLICRRYFLKIQLVILRLIGSYNQSVITLIARFMGPTWGPLGPTGPRWAPCWPHEPCYLGVHVNKTLPKCTDTGVISIFNLSNKIMDYYYSCECQMKSSQTKAVSTVVCSAEVKAWMNNYII